MTLLEQLRTDVGLPMGSWYAPMRGVEVDEDGEPVDVTRQRFIGWTTDEEKADRARDAGATVTYYRAHDERFSGWEVSINEVAR